MFGGVTYGSSFQTVLWGKTMIKGYSTSNNGQMSLKDGLPTTNYLSLESATVVEHCVHCWDELRALKCTQEYISKCSVTHEGSLAEKHGRDML